MTLEDANIYMSVKDKPCINYDSAVNGDKLTIVIKGECALNSAEGIMTDSAFSGTIELTGDGYLYLRGRNDDDAGNTAKDTLVMKMIIGSTVYTVNDKAYNGDAAPVIIDDRILVPIRVINETFGGSAAWDNATRTVTLKIDNKTITLQMGKTLDKYGVAPMIIGNRTYVPIRFVADELGATTLWLEQTKTVVIEK